MLTFKNNTPLAAIAGSQPCRSGLACLSSRATNTSIHCPRCRASPG